MKRTFHTTKLNVIVLFLDCDQSDADSYHGYVIKLTNIMTSLSKTKYFKGVLHDGSKEMSILSYNQSLYGTLTKGKDFDKPVKSLNYTKKLDKFTSKPLLLLASRSSILYSEKNIQYNKLKGVSTKNKLF